ncbi:hypothetical protein Hanom_Chr05g00449001 [Helianthus anomalus]
MKDNGQNDLLVAICVLSLSYAPMCAQVLYAKVANVYQYGARKFRIHRTGPHKTHKPDKIGCFRVHYVLAKLFNNRLLRMCKIHLFICFLIYNLYMNSN